MQTANNKGNAAEKPQRKRLTVDGVYIQDVNGKLWKTEDWDGSVKPNAIAVITPQHKFRIALTQISFPIAMNCSDRDKWEEDLLGTSQATAQVDYNGAANTKLIVEKRQPSRKYAAGWCNAYTFPDGVTKGYLPALGELHLTYNNKPAIIAALAKCGGTTFLSGYYWSSTFEGVGVSYRSCWRLLWSIGSIDKYRLGGRGYVRAFAPLEI